jgi:uncharacterized cupredoxin-like copper-binding protein
MKERQVKRTRWIAVMSVMALATIAAACSETAPTSEGMVAGSATEAAHDEELTFGEPAKAGDEDRVIEVTQSDEMRFDPASIEVQAGETILFEISNTGQTPHEFVLGDADLQAEHEEEMAEMGEAAMSNEPNAIAVEPGETGTIVWTFTESGALEYGCHVPGHYQAGMVGELTVV